MKNILLYLLSPLLIVWLVACGTLPATPMPTIPVPTPPVSQAAKPSATLILPEPTQTATPTPQKPTQTATPTPSATPNPTVMTHLIEMGQLVPSPDGQWTAIVNKEAGSLVLQGPNGETWASCCHFGA